MNADTKSLLYNVVGGIIVSVLTTIYIGVRHRFRSYHLQRLLGFQFKTDTEIRIVYGQLLLQPLKDPYGKPICYPYIKPPRRGSAALNESYSMAMSPLIVEKNNQIF
jgi:hypothetical protein